MRAQSEAQNFDWRFPADGHPFRVPRTRLLLNFVGHARLIRLLFLCLGFVVVRFRFLSAPERLFAPNQFRDGWARYVSRWMYPARRLVHIRIIVCISFIRALTSGYAEAGKRYPCLLLGDTSPYFVSRIYFRPRPILFVLVGTAHPSS